MRFDHQQKKWRKEHRGAVMVEFAVTLALFFALLLAIFEFVLLTLAVSRANEATRDIARHAIIRIPQGIEPPTSPEGEPISGDEFFEARARQHVRNDWVDTIRVSYEALPDDSGAFNVTVRLDGATYELFAPTLLGLSPNIPIPSLATSRISENLHNLP